MDFRSYLKDRVVRLDGGMGTLLQAAGLLPGEAPERWCLTHPETVTAIHREYLLAGSDVITANTFGASPLRFADDELDAVIGAAVACARRAIRETGREGRAFVALDVGPSGRLLAPLGDLDFEDAVSLFAATVRAGVRHGVDLILIETMNDCYETKAALLAAKENSTLPVIVTNAYGEDGKLLTGATPEAMAAMLTAMGADAIGANCSLGPRALSDVAKRLVAATPLPVIVQPNAGLPRTEGERTVYDVDEATFARELAAMLDFGVRGIGGCCGTTPAYVAALTEATADARPAPISEVSETVVSSYTHAVTFGKRPLLIGERINPTGKKRFREALLAHDIGYLLGEAVREEEAGADLLDVNVGHPEIDEVAMLREAVTEIQTVTDLPLCIDTALPEAMEAALRRYNGKPLLNSVNGKRESLSSVLPLAKKYGAAVIALTLDENGIPETAEGRLAIAERILAAAEEVGIPRRDIVFDTLTLTVSADATAPRTTLSAMEAIKSRLGCHTSLGVSNVSFGLPVRDAVNAVFFGMALERGLSAAIMNPHSTEMMKTYRAYLALSGLDEGCAGYIAAAEGFATAAPVVAPTATTSAAQTTATPTETAEGEGPLDRAIRKGLRGEAAALTEGLLRDRNPLSLIREEIVPALNAVGLAFEEGRAYLPSLLVSAEAASAALAVIKTALLAEGAPPAVRGPFVLATVRGDIHDIGKNIVRLLLESYGFRVIDLGRDVAPRAIVDAVLTHKAPLCGLSALMTTTVPAMRETVALLREEAPFCHVVVGGAVLTEEAARAMGAHHYAPDAMDGVRYAESICK